MAKTKKGGDKKSAGGRSSKLSKEMRGAIDKITELAQEPLAREIVVAAAGAALAARKDARKAAKQAAREAGEAIDESPVAAAWVGAAVTAAAIEAGRRLLEAYDKSQNAGTSGDPGDAAKPAKRPKAKKKTAARS